MNEPRTDAPRLLIVEAGPLDRDLCRRALPGYLIEFAPGVEAGLDRLVGGTFDLAVIGGAGLGTGGTVLDAIRGRVGPDLPVVFASGGDGSALALAVGAAIGTGNLAKERREVEAELRAQRDALQATLRQLREAQAHLVQSEKLASLGQLVAGVAHEINNPLAYVLNNLAVLDRDVRNVASLVDLYRAHFGEGLPPGIAEAEERIDLPYTLANLDRLLGSSRKGLERVREIVGGLRDFSRLDEAERKDVDPNELLREPLAMVRHSLAQKRVDLRLDLAELPRLQCSPGKLNQVVLNILLNAVQAVEPGARLDVSSRFDPDRGEVRLAIADTGPGIPPAILGRIFDPFFTTKPQGVGTGLGLWVGYNIVNEHGGRIEVESEVGRGATFTVVLPLVGPSPDHQ